jgi:hypothetical protein
MQNIKAAVGDDEFFATGSHGRTPGWQFVPDNDFVAEVHTAILPTCRRLATI